VIRLDANCLDCGEDMVVEMKDEEIISVQPKTIVGYLYSEIGGSLDNRPYR